MLSVLLVGAALARPYFGLSLGPGVLTGYAPGGSFVSYSPVAAVDVNWHGGPFQAWLGLSGSGLMAYTPDGVMPASALAAEAGAGFGSRTFSLGLYGGFGLPGGQVGLYSRLLVPTSGWLGRVGAEGRLFATEVGDAGGLALLLRVEPGREKIERRPEPPPPPPPPRRPPPPYARPYPPPPPQGPPVVAPPPEDAPPPPPPPPEDDDQHHDDPYADPSGDEHHGDPY